MFTDCCKHIPTLNHKAQSGWVYRCSKCGLESIIANSADNAKEAWDRVSSGCTLINSEHQLWKYHIGKM